MNIKRIISEWKNNESQKNLPGEESIQLPENPVGAFDLIEAELADVVGGEKNAAFYTDGNSCNPVSLIACC